MRIQFPHSVVLILAVAMTTSPSYGAPGTIKWQVSLDQLETGCSTIPSGTANLTNPAVGPDGTVYVSGVAINPDGSLRGCLTFSPTATGSHAVAGDGVVYTGTNLDYIGDLPSGQQPAGPVNIPSGAFNRTSSVRSDGVTYALQYFALNCNLIAYSMAPDGYGDVGNTFSSYTPAWDACSSDEVIGHDGTIYQVSTVEQQLVAFNPSTNTEKWRYSAASGMGPLALDSQDTIYVTTSTALLAINSSGTLKWSYPLQFGNWNAQPVIGPSGTVYVSDGIYLKAVSSTGQLKWTYTASCTPVVGQGEIVYCSGDSLYALSSSGALLWSVALGSGTHFLQPAIASDGTLYTGKVESRVVYAIQTASLGLAPSPWPRWRQNNQNSGLAGGASSPQLEVTPNKTRGKCDPNNKTTEGNPCNIATGNKFQLEADYDSAGPLPLRYVRYYNSDLGTPPAHLGPQWRDEFDSWLVISPSGPYVYLNRNDSKVIGFDTSNGSPRPLDADVVDQLVKIDSVTWQLTTADDSVETYVVGGDGSGSTTHAVLTQIKSRTGVSQTIAYAADGTRASVTDSFGRALTFAHDSQKRVSSVTDPAGNVFGYGYDANGYLNTVTLPGGATRQYHYDDAANPGALTSITDEAGNTYATWAYDGARRAISSQHAGGADLVTWTFNADGTTTVTDAADGVRTYTFSVIQNVPRTTQVTQAGVSSSASFDTNGFPASRTDRNGNVTTYQYNARGLEASRTEASGSPRARTITTQWHASFRLPLQITEPNRTTAFAYDSSGNLLTRTVTDTTVTPNATRTWTYTYDNFGHVLTVDGPRTDVADVTTYAYYTCTTAYQCGQIYTVTNAAGQVTTFTSYNAHGQPLTITDANGVATTLTYDARRHVASRQIGAETTGFSYFPTGLLNTVTLPDGSTVGYTYDAAHRLTQISDGLGNKAVYVLDAMGNRTSETTYDANNVLSRTHSRVYNTLNQLSQDIGAAGTAAVTTNLAYDNNGNQTSVNAPLSRNTANQYDELNRLAQTTDPGTGITYFGYDANDNLNSVLDPVGLTTTYSYNGFGDIVTEVSPQRGNTTNGYDSGGNLAASTDARGANAGFTYDSLNRVTQIVYGDQTLAFGYDVGTNGKGRLTSAGDSAHSMTWQYDGLGRVTGKSQTVGAVTLSIGYSFANGDLTGITTPSGQAVAFSYSNNHVTTVTVNGTTVLSGAAYEPFGPIRGWTWGNGTSEIRLHDADGNPSTISGSESHSYALDNAYRITGITNASNPAVSWAYGYDSLDRITAGNSPSTAFGFTYDGDGNRLTTSGEAGPTYAAGSLTLSYNNQGRLTSVASSGTTSYVYNAVGQRIVKTGPGVAVNFAYDESGHLIGEYDGSGGLIEETVWLGDLPVATLRPHSGGGVDIYYIHADHLGAPSLITRPSDNVLVWRWDSDPFGSAAPNSNPSGAGTFVYNLRFPGQYFDSETGLNYNYFRDYDSQAGRYVESDPLGLVAGVNTYAYVGGQPVGRVDSLGLWSPGGHDALYSYAFTLILDPAEIAIIQQESRALDQSTGIGTDYAYIHSMRKPFQSPADAKAASKRYICDKLRQARNEPDRGRALRDFADAAHTITDYLSPEHTDSSGNPKLWYPLLFAGHSPNDHVGHETVNDITPQIYQSATSALIDAYNQAFGRPDPAACGCK